MKKIIKEALINKEEFVKSVIVVSICNILIQEEMDNLKGTYLYKSKIKKNINEISTVLESVVEKTYEIFNEEDEEISFHAVSKLIEDFAKAIINAKNTEKLADLAAILQEYKKGNYKFIENDNSTV